MAFRSKFLCSVAACALIAGCDFPSIDSPPKFDFYGHDRTSEKKRGPTVSQVVTHLQCELEKAAFDGLNIDPPKDKGEKPSSVPPPELTADSEVLLRAPTYFHYVASVSLTLDVTNTEGLNPSIALINPYITGGNAQVALGGQLTGAQDRQMVVNFPVDFDKFHADWLAAQDASAVLTAFAKAEREAEKAGDGAKHETLAIQAENKAKAQDVKSQWSDCGDASGVRGDLGLAEILKNGSHEIRRANNDLYLKGDDTAAAALTNLATLTSPSTSTAPINSQLSFSITTAATGGPNWSITHFSGPSSSGLLGLNRVAKDTLIVSFVPSCEVPQKQAILVDLTNPTYDKIWGVDNQYGNSIEGMKIKASDYKFGSNRPVEAQDGSAILDYRGQLLQIELPNHTIANLRSIKGADSSAVKDGQGFPEALQWPDPGPDLKTDIGIDDRHRNQPEVLNQIRVAAVPKDPDPYGPEDVDPDHRPSRHNIVPGRTDFDNVVDQYWPVWIAGSECPFTPPKSDKEKGREAEVQAAQLKTAESEAFSAPDAKTVDQILDKLIAGTIETTTLQYGASIKSLGRSKSDAYSTGTSTIYRLNLQNAVPLQ